MKKNTSDKLSRVLFFDYKLAHSIAKPLTKYFCFHVENCTKPRMIVSLCIRKVFGTLGR